MNEVGSLAITGRSTGFSKAHGFSNLIIPTINKMQRTVRGIHGEVFAVVGDADAQRALSLEI